MSDNGETETKRTRKPRSRISYADRCREYERAAAVQQAKLGTIMTTVDLIEPAPGSEQVKKLAASLVREMIE